MQDRVLDAPRVLADGPSLDVLAPEWSLLVARGAVAEDVPARVDERVHRVGVASRVTTARRTGGLDEPVVTREGRLSARAEVDVVGELHRQVRLGHRDLAVLVAVDDRDRRAPVPLARDQPVAKPERNGGTAGPLPLQPLRDLGDRLRRALAVEWSRVHHHALVVVRLGPQPGVTLL